ncbi:MAG: NAD(P)-binding domain-containing protein [Thermoplasmatales archaeon]|nr:NAD(P)-binding domain-containing protein [Candidatus Thermoplasmatota archaeon]MCL6003397.1 NAD(P)-binding domain-containing protein [Candidatus Thermoplasmatota archaeon]MDA8056089.1 NAD(P)-binding domain-containing protein [Thermoplasmatales archaeon]
MEKGGIFLIRVTYGDLGSLYFSTIKDFQLEEVYDYIRKNERIEEALVLWTCNRFEIYFYPGDRETVEFLEDFIRDRSMKHSVVHGLDAIKHLFLVTAGLDSMVIGESEILAQVREAWNVSRRRGLSGTNLNEVLKKSLEVGRKARRENGNGQRAKSVAGEALDQINIIPGQTVLVIGAGDLGTQIASFLSRRGIHFSVSNRSLERAKEISKAFGAEVEKFEKTKWKSYDVVITATKASEPLLGKGDLLNSKIKTILDLGVPANVRSEVPKGVSLVNMETLSRKITRKDDVKNDYATKSLKTVNNEFEKFSRKLMNVEREEFLKKIFDYSNEVIEEEMKYFDKKTVDGGNSAQIRKGLESTRNKLLGFVINGIKNAKDIRSSETVTNMEMILNENFSRYEAKKVKKIA